MENTILEFMSSTKGLSTIGLACDMLGAILIWIYGIPSAERDSGISLDIGGYKEERERHESKVFVYDVVSTFGIIFLLLGFFLQIIANLFGLPSPPQ